MSGALYFGSKITMVAKMSVYKGYKISDPNAKRKYGLM